MVKLITIIFGVCLYLQLGTAIAKVYTWTDENGQIHYSSQPPPKAETREVEIKKHKPDQQTIDRLNHIKAKNTSSTSSLNKKIKQAEEKNLSESELEMDKKRCQRYKEQYERYKREGIMGVNLLTGETKKMSGESAEIALENARQNVEIFCD